MDIESFYAIIDKISPYAEYIKLHWIGEPLMHPDIISMISYAKNNTFARLHLSTNATLLKGSLAESIRTSGIDTLSISMDGNSPDTYESIRGKSRFNKTVDQVETYLRNTDALGGPTCHIKLIQFEENSHEIDSFRDRWEKYRCAAVEVGWLSDWAGAVDLPSTPPFPNPISETVRTPCSDLWFKMQIDWNGNIALCCFDANRTENLGNLLDSNVEDIWNGLRIKELRKQHVSGNYTGICKTCHDWASPNEYEFWYPISELKANPEQIWLNSGKSTLPLKEK